ncbi:MAG: hypothetical protein DWI22_14145 [Planctomycetota bacterium]|nr:MAG: hypothetical protein DWI22_14145 [Planctomycetota bacterium]
MGTFAGASQLATSIRRSVPTVVFLFRNITIPYTAANCRIRKRQLRQKWADFTVGSAAERPRRHAMIDFVATGRVGGAQHRTSSAPGAAHYFMPRMVASIFFRAQLLGALTHGSTERRGR